MIRLDKIRRNIKFDREGCVGPACKTILNTMIDIINIIFLMLA